MRDQKFEIESLTSDWDRLATDGKTPMYVAVDGRSVGLVAVADTVKDDSKQAIDLLKGMAIEVIMLTGDRSEERRVGEECRSRWSADH